MYARAGVSRSEAMEVRYRKCAGLEVRRDVVIACARVMTGRKVYFSKEGANCGLCHAIEGTQTKGGPSLASIGSKLGKEALLDAILNPSSGIAHE